MGDADADGRDRSRDVPLPVEEYDQRSQEISIRYRPPTNRRTVKFQMVLIDGKYQCVRGCAAVLLTKADAQAHFDSFKKDGSASQEAKNLHTTRIISKTRNFKKVKI